MTKSTPFSTIRFFRSFKRFLPICAMLCIPILPGCLIPGQNLYKNDPLTGGVNQAASSLLHITLPNGLQYYPSHSDLKGGSRKEGLEVWRGHIDQDAAANYIYNAMKQQGWQPRLMQHGKEKYLAVYQKNNEMAAILFQKQGVLTILQIWAGPRLSDNAVPSFNPTEDEPVTSMVGEEYGPITKEQPPAGKVETWGVEEREL